MVNVKLTVDIAMASAPDFKAVFVKNLEKALNGTGKNRISIRSVAAGSALIDMLFEQNKFAVFAESRNPKSQSSPQYLFDELCRQIKDPLSPLMTLNGTWYLDPTYPPTSFAVDLCWNFQWLAVCPDPNAVDVLLFNSLVVFFTLGVLGMFTLAMMKQRHGEIKCAVLERIVNKCLGRKLRRPVNPHAAKMQRTHRSGSTDPLNVSNANIEMDELDTSMSSSITKSPTSRDYIFNSSDGSGSKSKTLSPVNARLPGGIHSPQHMESDSGEEDENDYDEREDSDREAELHSQDNSTLTHPDFDSLRPSSHDRRHRPMVGSAASSEFGSLHNPNVDDEPEEDDDLAPLPRHSDLARKNRRHPSSSAYAASLSEPS
jgi:hypothetical protein